jgi:hypothetical protein
MKQPFGVKLAGSYMPAMPWFVANHKKEDAASVSMIGEKWRPPTDFAEILKYMNSFDL